jgi:DNA-binding NarL/FixJ family response regulator
MGEVSMISMNEISMHRDEQGVDALRDSAPHASKKLLSVFILDDQERVVRAIRRKLGQDGFTTRAATDPVTALREVATERPDVVLLDVHLDGVNGLDYIDWFRAAGFRGPVIVFSGDESFEMAHRAARAGADGYLVKGEIGALPELLRCLVRTSDGKGALLAPMPEAAVAYLATRGVSEWELVLAKELAIDSASEKAIAMRTGRRQTAVRKGFESIRRKLGATNQHDLTRMIGVLSCFGGRR